MRTCCAFFPPAPWMQCERSVYSLPPAQITCVPALPLARVELGPMCWLNCEMTALMFASPPSSLLGVTVPSNGEADTKTGRIEEGGADGSIVLQSSAFPVPPSIAFSSVSMAPTKTAAGSGSRSSCNPSPLPSWGEHPPAATPDPPFERTRGEPMQCESCHWPGSRPPPDPVQGFPCILLEDWARLNHL